MVDDAIDGAIDSGDALDEIDLNVVKVMFEGRMV